MKTPRDLYGRDFADHLIRRWKYVQLQQSGSHIILQSEPPLTGSLSIPAHKPLRVGTLNALIRLVSDQRAIARETVIEGL